MPQIRRTIRNPAQEDTVEVFYLPALTSRVIGLGVNNKVIYDLKKRGRSVQKMQTGTEIIFEVIGHEKS